MKIIPEKIIMSRIELTNDEYDILVDYKILLERMRHTMMAQDVNKAADITQEFLTAEINTVLRLMDKVDILTEV